MAATQVQLKPNVFLTLDDVKEWLGLTSQMCTANPGLENKLARLLNSVTDMAERHLNGPIKTRSIPAEFHDGDSSNTIMPDYWPVREIASIYVDFNRQFSQPTLIQKTNYILRGAPDPTFPNQVRGSDIVLRDDNETSIVGRIFTGSTVGSIKMAYTAGWGADQNEIPADLTQAILMGIEYYYRKQDSKDIGVKSKTVNGQSITFVQGLPLEVMSILNMYVDYTLGRNNRPQTNTFTL
jgi:hypothetical protein